MKSTILLLSALLSLHAVEITLTSEQEKDWSIVTELPTVSNITPQSTLLVEVVTPPQLLHTLSLPNEVTLTKLHINLYDSVKRGDALVSVSSPQWIEAQKSAISSSINYGDALAIDKRKQLLCSEQIIAKKECIASHSALLKAKNSLKASKELLSAYGANDSVVKLITTEFKVYSSLTLYSSVEGSIIESHAAIGKSFAAFEPLLNIKQDGDLWLEGALSVLDSTQFKAGDAVTLSINAKQFESKVVNLAPVINIKNQTRNIRFSVSQSENLLSGLRSLATLYIHRNSLKVPKKALIKYGKSDIVFVKSAAHYNSVTVNVLSQDNDYYYLEPQGALAQPIAVSSIAILKSMMESDDE